MIIGALEHVIRWALDVVLGWKRELGRKSIV
jgi:hypothetical protein